MVESMRTKADIAFDIINYIILTIALLIVLYPLYFVVIASISDPNMVNAGKVWIWPKNVTFEGYERVFKDPMILTGYKNSLMYAVIGTTIDVVLTVTAAYSLSRKDLKGRNFFMFLITFTMFFSGGMIPTYMLIKKLHMINTIWAMVIPGAVGVWNIIIARTFFQNNIPDELLEAALIDGCSNTKFFFSIVLPLSKPVIAILVLFYGVGHWNAFFSALIYLRDRDLFPLQLILRGILIQNQVQAKMLVDQDLLAKQEKITQMIKYALIIVSSVPVLIIYPFIQKHFVKGIMVGSIKG